MAISQRVEQLILTRTKLRKQWQDLEQKKEDRRTELGGSKYVAFFDSEHLSIRKAMWDIRQKINAFDVVIDYYRVYENDLGACIPDEGVSDAGQ